MPNTKKRKLDDNTLPHPETIQKQRLCEQFGEEAVALYQSIEIAKQELPRRLQEIAGAVIALAQFTHDIHYPLESPPETQSLILSPQIFQLPFGNVMYFSALDTYYEKLHRLIRHFRPTDIAAKIIDIFQSAATETLDDSSTSDDDDDRDESYDEQYTEKWSAEVRKHLNRPGNFGQTVLDLFIHIQDTKAVQLLKDAGACPGTNDKDTEIPQTTGMNDAPFAHPNKKDEKDDQDVPTVVGATIIPPIDNVEVSTHNDTNISSFPDELLVALFAFLDDTSRAAIWQVSCHFRQLFQAMFLRAHFGEDAFHLYPSIKVAAQEFPLRLQEVAEATIALAYATHEVFYYEESTIIASACQLPFGNFAKYVAPDECYKEFHQLIRHFRPRDIVLKIIAILQSAATEILKATHIPIEKLPAVIKALLNKPGHKHQLLSLFASTGDAEAIRLLVTALVEVGADINAKNGWKETFLFPLFDPNFSKTYPPHQPPSIPLLDWLIQQGADFKVRSEFQQGIYEAHRDSLSGEPCANRFSSYMKAYAFLHIKAGMTSLNPY